MSTGEEPGSSEPLRADQMGALLGDPVEISDEVLAACQEEHDFTRLAHGLYGEAGKVIAVCSCACLSADPALIALKRNQAILAGLLVRITKFMNSVARLAAEGDRREVVLALSRCIFESATNLRFLILKNDPALYDAYVRCGLGPERESYEKVTAAIKARGGKALPIEERMLESIKRPNRRNKPAVRPRPTVTPAPPLFNLGFAPRRDRRKRSRGPGGPRLHTLSSLRA